MITAIVLTKDRPAQLDLLLESIDRNGGGLFEPEIIVAGTAPLGAGYRAVMDRYDWRIGEGPWWWPQDGEGLGQVSFEYFVRASVETAKEFVCFMCDDGILYRPFDPFWINLNMAGEASPRVLCFSLRLGENTTVCYPSGLEQPAPRLQIRMGKQFADTDGVSFEAFQWDWTKEANEPGISDFGYPGSVDGHVFRRDDLLEILDGQSFPNPTALECALAVGCADLMMEKRPLMACFPQSVYVGNPVNRVSEQSNVRHGTKYPFDVEEAKRRFAAGERIDLDALDFAHVNGAHTEIELKWTSPVPA